MPGPIGTIIGFIMERRAAGASLDDIRAGLESSADAISGRMTRAADTPAARRQARHVIGIERWGAHRLRAGVEGPVMLDEYDSFCPPDSLSMEGLVQAFLEARAETLDLLERLGDRLDCRVVHNQLGALSVKAWLVYLSGHSAMESRKIR